MSPTKVAIAAVIFSCAVGALIVASRFQSLPNLEKRADTAPAISPPEVTIPEVSLTLAAQAAFGACLWTGTPTAAKAAHQVAVCSEAIQSRTLTPSQVAFARLQRGAARMALGDKVMASGDYTEALRLYDSAIDPGNPDALALYRRGASLDHSGKVTAHWPTTTGPFGPTPRSRWRISGEAFCWPTASGHTFARSRISTRFSHCSRTMSKP